MSDVEYATDKTYVDTYIHTAWCRPCMYVCEHGILPCTIGTIGRQAGRATAHALQGRCSIPTVVNTVGAYQQPRVGNLVIRVFIDRQTDRSLDPLHTYF